MLRVLLAVAFLVPSSAGAAEFAIAPTDRRVPSALGFQSRPSIATNGNGYLVAWYDTRPPRTTSKYASRTVRAMRLDADGDRIDGTDFPVARNAEWFSIASDGRDYLAMYTDGAVRPQVLRFVRIPAVGGAPEALPASIVHDYGSADLVYAGGHYVVATSGIGGVRVTMLDRFGSIVRGPVLVSHHDLSTSIRMAATRSGDVLIAWGDRQVYGRTRVAFVGARDLRDANVQPPTAFGDLGPGYPRAIAAGETGFGVLMYLPTGSEGEVRLTILDRSGGIAGPSSLVGRSDTPFDSGSIAGLGSGYLIAMTGLEVPGAAGCTLDFSVRVGVQRLDHSGVPLDPEFLEIAVGSDATGAVTARDGSVLLAWVSLSRAISYPSSEYPGDTVNVQRLSIDGEKMLPRDGVVASMSRTTRRDAQVARCPTFDLVVWREYTDSGWRIFFRRFSRDGLPLGEPAGGFPDGHAELACGRSTALLVWNHEKVRGALIDSAGRTRLLALQDDLWGAAVAFDGSSYVVAGPVSSRLAEALGGDVVLSRWTENGVRTDTAVLKVFPDGSRGFSTDVAVAWNGKELLYAWEEIHQSADGFNAGRLMAYRFDEELEQVGAPIEISALRQYGHHDIVAAASPDRWLVGWSRDDTARWDREHPYTGLLDRDGTLLDPRGGLVAGPAVRRGVRQVSWNGKQFEIVTPRGVTVRTRDGFMAEHALFDGDQTMLWGMTESGSSRLIVFSRVEPVDGVLDLFGDILPWDTDYGPKRRSTRH